MSEKERNAAVDRRYVTPNGDDAHSGIQPENPFATERKSRIEDRR